MSDAEHNKYGPAIAPDRTCRFTSASALTTADPNSYGGCLRAWWFEKIDKRKKPQTRAMKRGTEDLHRPIENYYATGARVFPDWVMAGQRYFYERGDDLAVEHEICLPFGVAKPADGQFYDLSLAPLRVAGIPVVGKIDLTHARGVYIDNAGQLIAEPFPNTTLEVQDWKSTSAKEYAKSEAELRRAIQMILYGGWAFTVADALDHVRLSHTYFLTKGAPESWKVTTLMDREELRSRMEYVEGVARSIADAAKETDADRVEANKKSCKAYRNGCPHKSYCSAAQHNSLASRMGGSGSQPGKGLVALTFKKKDQPAGNDAAPAPSGQPTVTHVATDAHVGAQLTMGTAVPKSMLDQLVAEEQAALAKPTRASVAAPQCPADVAAAFAVIARLGAAMEWGAPMFSGQAAQLYALANGRTLEGQGFAGSGSLAGLEPITTPEAVLALARDLETYAAGKQPKSAAAPEVKTAVVHNAPPIAVLPPETPASDPKLAALPVAGLPEPGAPAVSAPVTEAQAGGADEGGKKRGGRPKGSKNKPETQANVKCSTIGSSEFFGDLRFLYLNCTPSVPYEDFASNIAELWAGLTKQAGCDPRATNEKPFGFGGWKGIVADAFHEALPDLPPGHYVLYTDGDINTCVAEACLTARTAEGASIFDVVVRGAR